MWRSASGFVLRRRLPRRGQHQRSVTGWVSESRAPPLLASNGGIDGLVGRSANRRRDWGRSFASSGNDDDDEEGWIPPVRAPPGDSSSPLPSATASSETSSTASSLPKSQRIETILEVSRQVKEQERLDRALEETEKEAEALFQLNETEQATLTDDEILERLEEVLKREEELEERAFREELEREEEEDERRRREAATGSDTGTIPLATDWLRNRRARLGRNGDDETSANVVPILPDTLLTADEIRLLLEAHGGGDIVVMGDDPDAQRMGGAEGMIFCTAGGGGSRSGEQSTTLALGNGSSGGGGGIATLSRVLIDHLKDRGLQNIAPSAAQNTTNRAALGASAYGPQTSESWRIVDCGNYIVHILDEDTRWDLNLEDLWSGADPLWTLNVFDDDAVEDYCQKHPVPSTYNGTGSSRHAGLDDDDEEWLDGAALKKLERTRFGHSRRHNPVVPQSTRNKDRRIGRKKRRDRRQRDYFGSSFD